MRITEPKENYFPLRGGLDLVTPPYQIKPGKMLSCMRYEIAASGGYKPVDGYERIDGHGVPSEALFQYLVFADPALTFAVDTVIVGETSAASGVSLVTGVVDFGDGVDVDTTGSGAFLVTGTFVNGENIKVGGTVVGNVSTAYITNGAESDLKEDYFHWLAVEKLRSLVEKVPGSGPIRGVWRYDGELYAFRDDALGTAGAMYKEAAAGWVLITTPALAPGGSYRFENINFGGAATSLKMYGCDGKNKAFEFDGTTFNQITTGMTTDTPFLITEHKKHLFLGFANGSLQHSPPTDPRGTWSVVVDAGELGMGEEITEIKSLPGDVLGIWCRDSIHLLSGTGVGSWVLATHAKETGGIKGTVQNTGKILFLNNTGIAELSATNAYGNFKSATISNDIQPLIDSLKRRAVCSVAVASKNQYRIFFDDGHLLTASFVGREVQFTQSLYNVVVRCISAPTRADDEMGNIYFGSDDGYIYKMDSGVSLDHQPMIAYFRLPYSHQGAPRQKKRYRELVLELDSFRSGDLKLEIHPDFTLSSDLVPPPVNVSVEDSSSQAAIWDLADWNSFSWDNVSVVGGGGTAKCRISGVASEIGLVVFFNADKTTTPLHVLNGIFIYYNFLGRVR